MLIPSSCADVGVLFILVQVHLPILVYFFVESRFISRCWRWLFPPQITRQTRCVFSPHWVQTQGS